MAEDFFLYLIVIYAMVLDFIFILRTVRRFLLRHTPQGLVCTKRFDALRFEGLTVTLPFTWRQYFLKFRGKAVSLGTVSSQVPPIFVVIIVFFAPGIQSGIEHCSCVCCSTGSQHYRLENLLYLRIF